MIEDLRARIVDALKGKSADYIEVHLEEGEGTRLQYRGRELEEVGRSSSIGGNVRALVKGGWGFVCFNDLNDLPGRIDLAVKQAQLVGKEKSQLAPVIPVVDFVKAKVGRDPGKISLAHKKELLDLYNDTIWSVARIQTSVIGYGDSRKKLVFANTEGSYIEQDKVDVVFRAMALARDGGEVQQSHLSLGNTGDFSKIEGLQVQVKEMAEKAVALLAAPRAKGGEYTVVLDPVLAGVFVHEAFGHLSESDFVYENDRMREVMVLGRKFGADHLNIVDGAAVPGLRGSYKYDDEGVPSTKTYLIKEGVLSGRLHSRETAGKMGENPSGNARAIDYHHPPIVRMTNTYIEAGKVSFPDMIADIKEGIYARNWYGGTTSMEMFTFSAGEAYMIRNGRVAELLRPVTLTGNVFTTLQNIDAVGDDLAMNEGGGCGKGDQVPLPVSDGSPHIRIRHCLVGGKELEEILSLARNSAEEAELFVV